MICLVEGILRFFPSSHVMSDLMNDLISYFEKLAQIRLRVVSQLLIVQLSPNCHDGISSVVFTAESRQPAVHFLAL